MHVSKKKKKGWQRKLEREGIGIRIREAAQDRKWGGRGRRARKRRWGKEVEEEEERKGGCLGTGVVEGVGGLGGDVVVVVEKVVFGDMF